MPASFTHQYRWVTMLGETMGVLARIALVLILALRPIPTIAATPDKSPEELILSGDNIITVEINGRPTRLEVRPDAAGAPTINPEIAKKLGFKPGMFGFIIAVGPVRVLANSAVHKINFGAKPEKQRILWADKNVSSIAEGTISPASLPYKRVVFKLNPERPAEQVYRYPLDNFGFLGRVGMGTTIVAKEEKVQVIFSLIRDQNLVSAPTGNWFSKNYDGVLAGPATSTVIYYGVERPTRAMKLRAPLAVGNIAISDIAVRVSDFGDASGIAEEHSDAVPASADSQEIVVTGKKKADVDLRLTIGRGVLGRCSTLVYDLAERELRMSCAL